MRLRHRAIGPRSRPPERDHETLGVRQELIAWLALLAVAFGTVFSRPGFMGSAANASLLGVGFLSRYVCVVAQIQENAHTVTTLPKVVDTIVFACVCSIVPVDFLDSAAWYM